MRVFTLLCAFFILNTSFSAELQLDYNSIPKALLTDADAVVRLDQMKVTVASQDFMRVSSKRIITVLNENGNKHVHAYAFYEKNDRVVDLEAVIYNAQGEEINTIKKRDFLDQSAISGGTLYSDSRVKYMRYTPIAYPYTVVLTKEYTTPNTAFLPSWRFLDGYRVSTEKSEYEFLVECGIPFRLKEENFGAYSIKGHKNDASVKYIGSNLGAIEAEPMSPIFSDIAPSVKLALESFHLEGVDGNARNWNEFGKWIYDELLFGRDDLNPETVDKITQLVKGIDSPLEKIRLVYEYVQNNTRYISVQLGIGGWMPINAQEVDMVKYGDCKGLTNYTKALLKVAGIDSYYTVVYAGSQNKNLDKDFPSIQGNHAFLNVPLGDEDIWLECTSQVTPVNHLGTFTDDRWVLRVTPDGGEMVKTKRYTEEENLQLTQGKYFVTKEGHVKGQVEILSKGIPYNQKFRLSSNSEDEKEKHYKEYWNYVDNLSLSSISFENDTRKIEFKENVEISAENYGSNIEGKVLFAPNLFNRNLFVPKRSRNRKNELLIRRGYLDQDEFTIHLPKDYEVESLIESTKIETKFGTYTMSIESKSKHELIYKRSLRMNAGRFKKEDYKSYRDFKKQIARIDNSRIVLTKI